MVNNKTLLLFTIALAVASCEWRLFENAFDQVSLQPSDLEGWTFTSTYNGNEITTCGQLSVIGGYESAGAGAILSKQFSELPEHYKVKLSLTIFMIDSWDNEFFIIKANTSEIFREYSHLNWNSPLCGYGWGARVVTIEFEFGHNSPDLLLQFTSTLDEDAANESWAIRDFQIYLEKCEKGCELLSDEFKSPGFTAADVVGWTQSRAIAGNLVQDCQGNTIVGGYNSFGNYFKFSKTYSNIPAHYKVVIAFRLWQIDSWDGNEKFRVTIDGKSAFSQLKTMGAWGGQYQCGNAYGDQAIDVTIEFPHASEKLFIEFEDNLDDNPQNESWGINNLRIYLIKCEESNGCTQVTSEFQEESFNDADVTEWFVNGTSFSKTASCQRISLLGGYNNLAGGVLSKTYTKLPPHQKVILTVELWLIDSWDNEDFTVSLDYSSAVTTTKGQGAWAVNLGNVCGAGWTEEIQLLYIEQPHFNDELLVRFISELNQAANDESFGIRELSIYVVNDPVGELVASSLTVANFDETAWAITNPAQNKSSFKDWCGLSILGGYMNFYGATRVTRTFSNLPEHTFIHIFFRVAFIDSWDKESFTLQIDGKKRKQMTKLGLGNLSGQQLCGHGGYEDFAINVSARFEHSAPTVFVELFSMLDEWADDESWGFGDFYLYAGKHDFAGPDCPTLYTECGFEGESFNLCENVADFSSKDWTEQVHSVWVPEGWTVTLFENVEFGGAQHVFTESADCLTDGPVYQLIRLSQGDVTHEVNLLNAKNNITHTAGAIVQAPVVQEQAETPVIEEQTTLVASHTESHHAHGHSHLNKHKKSHKNLRQ